MEAFLTLKERHILLVNHRQYFGIITWKLHTETIAAKALRIFISIYPILKSERLSVGANYIQSIN